MPYKTRRDFIEDAALAQSASITMDMGSFTCALVSTGHTATLEGAAEPGGTFRSLEYVTDPGSTAEITEVSPCPRMLRVTNTNVAAQYTSIEGIREIG